MAYEVHVSKTRFEINPESHLLIAHPKFVPIMSGDLLTALDGAIIMLENKHTADVVRAYDYALARVCFPFLRAALNDQVADFVENPGPLHSLGFIADKTDETSYPVHDGIARYFLARGQIQRWATNQLKMPNVPSAPVLNQASPNMASWLKVVYLIWSGEVARDSEMYRVTEEILQDTVQGPNYVRACSLAWLQHIRDKQPGPDSSFRRFPPLGDQGEIPTLHHQ